MGRRPRHYTIFSTVCQYLFEKKNKKFFYSRSGKIKGGFVRLLVRSVVPPAVVRILFIQSNVCVVVFIKSQFFSSLRVCYCFLQNLLGSCFVASRKANQKISSALNRSDYCVLNFSFFHFSLPFFLGAFVFPSFCIYYITSPLFCQ